MLYPSAHEIRQAIKEACAPFVGQANPNVGIAVGVLWPTWSELGCYVVSELFAFEGHLINHQNEKIKGNQKAPFKIASMSKTFTATLYAYAWLTAQKITPSTELGQALPQITSSKLTGLLLSQMANYTSGLPKDNDKNNGTYPTDLKYPYTFQEMYEFLNTRATLQVGPAGEYAYSNLGFALLGAALNQVLSGPAVESLDALETALLKPLGMNHTHVYSGDDDNTLAVSYDSPGKEAPVSSSNEPAYEGAGGLVSNIHDLLIWLRANLGLIPGPLRPLLEIMQTPTLEPVRTPTTSSPGVTLGWMYSQPSWSSENLYTKDGGKTGFGSLMGFIPRGPSLSSAVVVLSNLAEGVVNGKATSVKSYVFNRIMPFVNGFKDSQPIEALEMDV